MKAVKRRSESARPTEDDSVRRKSIVRHTQVAVSPHDGAWTGRRRRL